VSENQGSLKRKWNYPRSEATRDEEEMILDKIIETKKEEVAQLKKQTTVSALKKTIAQLEPCRDFRQAISS